MFHVILDCVESYKNSAKENVRILTKDEIENHAIQESDYTQISFETDFELFAYTPSFSRQLLAILAGHDLSKIDFAIPQSYADDNETRIYTRHDWALWSYERQDHGEPIHYKQLLHEFISRIRKAIIAQLNLA